MIDALKRCKRCSKIPDSVSVDLLGNDGIGISDQVMSLPGMAEQDLSLGYRTWETVCDLCGSEYKMTVDVEPMVWDFTLRRTSESAENHYITKDDFVDQYDFDAIGRATEVKVHMKNGDSHHVFVVDYWPTDKFHADYLHGTPVVDQGDTSSPAVSDFMVPNPDIDHIEILKSGSEPNHASHPEYAFSAVRLDELFKSK